MAATTLLFVNDNLLIGPNYICNSRSTRLIIKMSMGQMCTCWNCICLCYFRQCIIAYSFFFPVNKESLWNQCSGCVINENNWPWDMYNDDDIQSSEWNPCKVVTHFVGTQPVPLPMCGTLFLATEKRHCGCLQWAYFKALLSFTGGGAVTWYFFYFAGFLY